MFTSLSKDRPDLSEEWAPDNILSADMVSCASRDKFSWICRNNPSHKWLAAVYARRNGRGCPYCSNRKVCYETSLANLNKRVSDLWDLDKNHPITPAMVFPNATKKYWFKCLNGHSWEEKPNKLHSMKIGCPFCSGKRFSSERSIKVKCPGLMEEWDDKKDPSTVSYGDNKTKIKWKCKTAGHQFYMVPHARHRGRGCPYCSGTLLGAPDSKTLANTYPHIADELSTNSNIRPENISPYSDKKLNFICLKCNKEYKTVVRYRTRMGSACPHCALTHTNLEKFIENLFDLPRFNQYVFTTRQQLPYRPDFKFTDLIYMNTDGLYWHSDQGKEDNYHLKLRRAFATKGLRILQFYEDEVYRKPEIIKSMVNTILGKSLKIGARKFVIDESVPHEEAGKFLDTNHLIGGSQLAVKHVGLRDSAGCLKMVISYRIHKDHLETSRVCTELNLVIVGGLSRLLRVIQSRYPGMKIRTIVDYRYADGHSLERLGFIKVKEYQQYQYTNGEIRKDKRNFRVLAGVNERKEAAKQGWFRIYDAGKAVYECL